MIWLVCVLSLGCIGLAAKLLCMRVSLREITAALQRAEESNTLIDLSSLDASLRAFACTLNEELRTLRSQRQRYLAGDKSLKDAAANLSHDLRTPLTAISGYLELLSREEHTDASRRYLGILSERAEAMKQMTEELFHLTVTLSSSPLHREEVNLCAALEESLASHYTLLCERHITPEILLPGTPVLRSLNHEALSRIFGNLLTNAARYSDGNLRIMLTRDGSICFQNHASGLDAVEANRLFDRFHTVDSARHSTGLGLSIVKTLTEQLGGQVEAEYRSGMLTIRIFFP